MNRSQWLIILLLWGSVTGCAGRVSTQQVEERVGKQVTVQGEVTEHAPFLQGGGYKLEDEVGTVWVMSEETLPPLGTSVSVTGLVKEETVSDDDTSLKDVYLIEAKRNDE